MWWYFFNYSKYLKKNKTLLIICKNLENINVYKPSLENLRKITS